jgi:ATP-binding cassette, subfamily B, bacterial
VSATSTSAPPAADEPPSSPVSARQVLRDGARLIWSYIRHAPLAYALAAGGALAFTAGIVASAMVIGWVTDEVVVPVVSEGEPTDGRVLAAVAALLAVAVWKALGIVLRRTAAGWLAFGTQRRLRLQLIDHQLRLSLRWYRSRGVGDLLSVSDVDTQQATGVLHPLPFATGVVGLLVGAGVLIMLTDPLLGVLAIVLLATVVAVDARGAWRTFAAMEEAQRRRGRVAEVAHESFDGALTVKALGREDTEVTRFRGASDALRDQLIDVGRVWTGYRAVTDTLPAVGTVVVLVAGTVRLADGALSVGELVQVAYLLSLLAVPVRLLGYLLWDTANSVAAWNRVDAVLRADDTVDHGDRGPQQAAGPAAVVARGVSFSYGDGTPVLHELDLEIPAGRTVAIVGPTGAGKSTLALVLARLWDPDEGSVQLDDRDVRELAPGAVAAEVAYVSQDTFLFDDTVAGNVRMGLDVTDAEVERALHLANASGFVRALPDGLATQLGERGATLSGGQRQRIALARALVRQPRLLVLDDATSAVDPSVEAAILRGLRRVELPATVVVVAYRRSSILLADEVVYVDDGHVVAHGTHGQLLRTVPGYAQLVEAYDTDAAARAAARRGPAERRDGSAPERRS